MPTTKQAISIKLAIQQPYVFFFLFSFFFFLFLRDLDFANVVMAGLTILCVVVVFFSAAHFTEVHAMEILMDILIRIHTLRENSVRFHDAVWKAFMQLFPQPGVF